MLITSNQMDLSRFRFYPDFWLLHNVFTARRISNWIPFNQSRLIGLEMNFLIFMKCFFNDPQIFKRFLITKPSKTLNTSSPLSDHSDLPNVLDHWGIHQTQCRWFMRNYCTFCALSHAIKAEPQCLLNDKNIEFESNYVVRGGSAIGICRLESHSRRR